MPSGQACFSAGASDRGHAIELLVVDAGVEAELVDHVVALVGAAGDADGAAATRLGQLADRAADRAAGRAHDDGLARLGLDDLHQPVPGRDAGHADRAQVRRERHARGVDLAQHAGLRRVDHRVLLPAAHADDLVAGLVAGVSRLDHLAHRAADHHRVQRLRLRRSSCLRSCGRACTDPGSGSGGAPAPGRPAAPGSGASSRRKFCADRLAGRGARRARNVC